MRHIPSSSLGFCNHPLTYGNVMLRCGISFRVVLTPRSVACAFAIYYSMDILQWWVVTLSLPNSGYVRLQFISNTRFPETFPMSHTVGSIPRFKRNSGRVPLVNAYCSLRFCELGLRSSLAELQCTFQAILPVPERGCLTAIHFRCGMRRRPFVELPGPM